MSLLEQLLAIMRNTFLESIRQPVVLVVCVAATILIVLTNPFSAWTMQDDQRMFVDIGLSTVFLATAVLAAFLATNVLSREIENRTVLTVVSKPVPRPIFIVGKFHGLLQEFAKRSFAICPCGHGPREAHFHAKRKV